MVNPTAYELKILPKSDAPSSHSSQSAAEPTIVTSSSSSLPSVPLSSSSSLPWPTVPPYALSSPTFTIEEVPDRCKDKVNDVSPEADFVINKIPGKGACFIGAIFKT